MQRLSELNKRLFKETELLSEKLFEEANLLVEKERRRNALLEKEIARLRKSTGL